MEPLNNLETTDIKLRELEPEDLEILFEWENDTNLWIHGNTLKPYSRYQIKEYIKNSSADIFQTKQQRFMIYHKNDNKTIGTIDLFDIDFYNKRAEIGVLIYPKKYRNKGYATQALQLIVKYSKNILYLKQLYCSILTKNNNSINLFKSQDFEITGEKKMWILYNDKWENQYFLQKIL